MGRREAGGQQSKGDREELRKTLIRCRGLELYRFSSVVLGGIRAW